jgi:hypothetical protein
MNSRTKPTWSDVKARLQEFDRTGLLTLIQDLYAASKDNQVFLHARYGLGEDVLKPYKQTIDRRLPRPRRPSPTTRRRSACRLAWLN